MQTIFGKSTSIRGGKARITNFVEEVREVLLTIFDCGVIRTELFVWVLFRNILCENI